MILSKFKSAVFVIIIIALGFVAYSDSMAGKFIWDDNSLIVDNSVVKSWANIPGIFTKDNISTPTGKTFHFYRPVQIITYMYDYSLWGLDPKGYHLTNILLHVLAALALFWFLNMLCHDSAVSFIASALFIVHPVHSEAVSYISGRADALSLSFMLVAFIFYIKGLERRNPFFYAVVFFSYALALLSRESAIIFPVLVLLYHYSFSGDGGLDNRKAGRLKRKFSIILFTGIVAITVAYIAFRATSLKHLIPVYALSTTLTQRLPGFFVALANYIKLLFLPIGLHMEYGNKLFKFSDPIALAGVAVLIFLLALAFAARNRKRIVFFSVSWFLIALLPVSNLYPAGAYMAEHWLYLPSVGFFLIIAGAAAAIYKKRGLRIVSVGLVAMFMVFYCYLTAKQNAYWVEPVAFYETTLKHNLESPRAYNDLAIAYEKAGKHREAIDVYTTMLSMDPKNPDVYVNLAAVYIVIGKNEEAVELCNRALAIQPENATAHNNLAVAYYVLRKYDLAIKHCDLAVAYGYKVKPELLELLKFYRDDQQEY